MYKNRYFSLKDNMIGGKKDNMVGFGLHRPRSLWSHTLDL